jgi:N-acetylglucosamine-6-phosphate deacetylase
MTLIHGARKVDAAGVVEDFWVHFDGDAIAATGVGAPPSYSGERVDAAGRWLAPGFVDLHCHGAGGASFDDGVDAIERALAVHRAHGTTRSVISLVANPLEDLESSLAGIAELTRRDPLVLGSHLEGPFLAAERKGAHNPAYLLAPSPPAVDRLIRAADGTLRQLTLAVELPGAPAAITRLREAGVLVAVGHTEADEMQAQRAFDAGASLLTHVFNAMRGIGHRDPGPVVAALQDERVTVELILDGVHVHPDVARLVFRAAPGRVALITDAMAAAGELDGRYRLGSLDVDVTGGVARLCSPDGALGSIAGSTLTLDGALARAVDIVGLSPTDAVAALTLVPARALGLDSSLGLLEPGYAADAVLLSADWLVDEVWAAGRRVGSALG